MKFLFAISLASLLQAQTVKVLDRKPFPIDDFTRYSKAILNAFEAISPKNPTVKIDSPFRDGTCVVLSCKGCTRAASMEFKTKTLWIDALKLDGSTRTIHGSDGCTCTLNFFQDCKKQKAASEIKQGR
ncbi:hypothetical protein DSO57_1016401 [Entomophthora muscae]|uniref:Uncharacterized protein n=2 Tax=Entomophthora muscae TaxID=34485 RepID=A0ACC2S713_9FUNG|nr:hypothetical protein DSO57_1016400 [Entomophthora muscae]KAJ9058062.1 hypothetical protein DSO57_1016401 [Entomophthora muscae]